jgi:hypothetical protein
MYIICFFKFKDNWFAASHLLCLRLDDGRYGRNNCCLASSFINSLWIVVLDSIFIILYPIMCCSGRWPQMTNHRWSYIECESALIRFPLCFATFTCYGHLLISTNHNYSTVWRHFLALLLVDTSSSVCWLPAVICGFFWFVVLCTPCVGFLVCIVPYFAGTYGLVSLVLWPITNNVEWRF